MQRIRMLILPALFFLGSGEIRSQNAIVGSGFSSGWGGGGCPTGSGNFTYLGTSAGTSYIVTRNPGGTGNQFFRFGIDWGGTTAQRTITIGSDVAVSPNTTYNLNSACTTSGAISINCPNTTDNYVFKTLNAGNNPTGTWVFFRVQGAVQSVSSVSRSPSGTVFPGQDVSITANLSAAFATGQQAYLRYTTNNFASSVVVAGTGTGTTRTFTIPASVNTPGANLSFYIFTSGDSGPAADGSNADLYTINLNNNGGTNYSYSVASGWTTAAGGNWATAATWTANAVPPTSASMGTINIGHSVTQNANAVASGIVINASGSLTASANTLTISNNTSGITFSNSGTMTLSGSHAVTFSGTATHTVSGTANFHNVNTGTGVNFGSASTINGTFTLNAGGFVSINAPTYGTSSTLNYNTGGTYTTGTEWTANSQSGTGVPFNVTLSAASTSVNFGAASQYRRLRGTLTLSASTSFSLSTAIGGDLQIGGSFNNNGSGINFFPNNREVTFNGSAAQTIGGSNTTNNPFEFLAITNTGGDVTTSRSLTVNQRLQMNSGRLILGNNNLTLATAAVFDQGGAGSYVVTNGTGTVTQHVSGSNEFFPVGPSISIYGPITLNQSGTADNISVRVSTAPAFTNAVNDNSKMVNLEWTLNEGTAGGNNLRTTFGWSAASEAASFDRSAGVFHGAHNGTRYVVRASEATTGSNPYSSLSTASQPYTGNLSSQRFVVGNIAGILPCLQTGAAGNWAIASNWFDGVIPPAGSNVCIRHAISISSSVASPSGVTLENGGSLSISNGSTLTLESPGTITNSSGSFLNMTTGSIAFSGLGIVNGASAIGFNNLELNGNTTLTTTPTINGILDIKAGGFLLNAIGPNYGASSTLRYNTGGNYNRSNK